MEWFFCPIPLTGGATSDAYLNPLAGSGLLAEGILGREAVQNSSDALDPDEDQVYIRIKKKRLNAKQVSELNNTMQVSAMLENRGEALGLTSSCALNVIAGHASGDIDVLIIEDFNTVGLGGSIFGSQKAEDHFMKLVFRLGSSNKVTEDDTSGGSFGYGKSVYSAQSDSKTVIYYSAFAETDRAPNVESRLIGASIFQDHAYEDRSYDGRAFWGLIGDVNGETVVKPIINKEAHEIAEKIGFETRSDADYGLSMMIIGVQTDMDLLRSQIEKYWWPKIIDNEVAIELFDGEKKLASPSPRKRDNLLPFLRCYDFLMGRDTPDHQLGEKVQKLQRLKNKELGSLAAVRINTLEDEDEDFDNRVVLVRQAKMVVDYKKMGIDGLPKLAGVFLADPESDPILRLSEPPAHNNWDHSSHRLEIGQSNIVKRIMNRAEHHFREFQKALAPPEPPATGRLKVLERLLANLIPNEGQGPLPIPEPSEPDHFQIENLIYRLEDDEGAYLSGIIKIKLRDDAAVDAMDITIRPSIGILENETKSSSEKLNFSLEKEDGEVDIGDKKVDATASITKESFVKIKIDTERVNRDWILELVENIENVDPATKPQGVEVE
jgi:hypothetical protein